MTVYRECPVCGAEKAWREEGQTEYDTNTHPYLVVDESLSCDCELTVEQWRDMQDTIEVADFSNNEGYHDE